MKFAALIFSASFLSPSVWAMPSPTPIKVLDAELNAKTMDIELTLNFSTPCDHIASPQVVQDPKNPLEIKIQAQTQRTDGICSKIEITKYQTVSLPALIEMNDVQISTNAVYNVHFEGYDPVLVVRGNQLKKFVQPVGPVEM
jgi:hypothetical protein